MESHAFKCDGQAAALSFRLQVLERNDEKLFNLVLDKQTLSESGHQ
jgi:hypothetical protein